MVQQKKEEDPAAAWKQFNFIQDNNYEHLLYITNLGQVDKLS